MFLQNTPLCFLLLFEDNRIFATDSYKFTHWKQIRKGTTKIISYMESRLGAKYQTNIFAGLQPYAMGLAGKVLSKERIEAADWFCRQHFNRELFNKRGWLEVLDQYGGIIPITVKAVKEGSEVGISNVLITFENNGPEWLTQYFEGYFQKVWYTTVIATNSFYCKRRIKQGLERTHSDMNHLEYALHDFGYRGVSSEEQAGLGGMAHLMCFKGTDNVQGIIAANKYYNPDVARMTFDNYQSMFKMYGYSIAASEHSIATPFGRGQGELDYIKNMLEVYPDSPFSIVMDSYDQDGFIDKVAQFKEQITERESFMVLRPDSGDPIEENLKIVNKLWNVFGGEYHGGFRRVNRKVAQIQGDSIDYDMVDQLCSAFENGKWCLDGLVMGSGGGLLQKFNRDTNRNAIKCNKTVIDGVDVDVVKDPIDKSKKSKGGDLKLIKAFDGSYSTISSMDMTRVMFNSYEDQLETVFENGELKRFQTFEDIRETINKQL